MATLKAFAAEKKSPPVQSTDTAVKDGIQILFRMMDMEEALSRMCMYSRREKVTGRGGSMSMCIGKIESRCRVSNKGEVVKMAKRSDKDVSCSDARDKVERSRCKWTKFISINDPKGILQLPT